jgi:hypothetical protein
MLDVSPEPTLIEGKIRFERRQGGRPDAMHIGAGEILGFKLAILHVCASPSIDRVSVTGTWSGSQKPGQVKYIPFKVDFREP